MADDLPAWQSSSVYDLMRQQQRQIVIIGSGFSGLSAACFLAQAGEQVIVIEKHDQPGGRARTLEAAGFTFDMGPSWYWMPGVFERFFSCFDKEVRDYYELVRLDPSYKVYWHKEATDIPASLDELRSLFEDIEPGSGKRLQQYLAGAQYKYEVGMDQLVYKPGRSVMEFANADIMKGLLKLQVLTSAKSHISKYFKHPKLQQLMEFPLLFLGALAENTPALYSLMNYADMVLGTWYPMGGMTQVVKAMYSLACSLGVEFKFEEDATEIVVDNGIAQGIRTRSGFFDADIVLGCADYHFIETSLLAPKYRSYSKQYWESRKLAPSCLIHYIGLNKKIEGLQHHNLFFDAPFDAHAHDIYKQPNWPQDPLFYVSCPSKTDDTVAPTGYENLFILIPVAPGMSDNESIREKYFNIVMDRLEQRIGEAIRPHIIYKNSYAHTDFVADYNAFKGNAYGLANTLDQTAILKPSIQSKKVTNLFYAGQLTVPGPGVPPCIISGEVVAKEILKHITGNSKTYSATTTAAYE